MCCASTIFCAQASSQCHLCSEIKYWWGLLWFMISMNNLLFNFVDWQCRSVNVYIFIFYSRNIYYEAVGSVPHLMFEILHDIGPVYVIKCIVFIFQIFPTLYVYAYIFVINSNTLHFHILIDCYQQHIRWNTRLIITCKQKPSQH